MGNFSGRNAAVEKVAALLFLKCGLGMKEQESQSFTFINTLDSGLAETEDLKPSNENIEAPIANTDEVDTEVETLRKL